MGKAVGQRQGKMLKNHARREGRVKPEIGKKGTARKAKEGFSSESRLEMVQKGKGFEKLPEER